MTLMGWIAELPPSVVPMIVGLALVAESGLLVGVVLPGASLVIGLGVLTGTGLVPMPTAALTVAVATVLGAALGHRAALQSGSGLLLATNGRLGRRLPERARNLINRSASPWADVIGRRPVHAAATAQFIAGARTLAPRIAARTGVPLFTMLRGTVPAALLWSWGLVLAGATAGASLPLLRGMVALVGLPLVVAVTWLLHRRRRGTPAAPPDAVAG